MNFAGGRTRKSGRPQLFFLCPRGENVGVEIVDPVNIRR